LQNGVWVLPRNPDNTIFMERLLAFVKENEASGQIFRVQGLSQAIDDDLAARFVAERAQEYDEFLEQCAALTAEINKEARKGKFTFAELEENEQNFQRLQKWLAKIQKRDAFKSEPSQAAVTAFENCRQALQNYTRQVYTQEGIDSPPGTGSLADDSTSPEPGENDEHG